MPGTVFITGANAGVGLATARLFLAQGFSVAATARNPSSSPELQELLSQYPSALLVLPMDLLSPESIDSAVSSALSRFGRIDVLVNNAGYGQYGPLELISAPAVQNQFAANVFGPIQLIKLFLAQTPPAASSKDDGAERPRQPTIINVSSGGPYFGFPLASLYTASKAALDMLTESLMYELSALSSPVSAKLVVPHGIIIGTTFGRNLEAMGPLFAQDNEAAANVGAQARADYEALVGRQMQMFQALASNPAAISAMTPASRVAERIFEAATDGKSDKLRYFVGPDAHGGAAAAMDLRFAGPSFEGEGFDEIDERYVSGVRKIFG
ncbi:hypothetical protein EsH8_I_000769 [Colletotrichum jinshuiense]